MAPVQAKIDFSVVKKPKALTPRGKSRNISQEKEKCKADENVCNSSQGCENKHPSPKRKSLSEQTSPLSKSSKEDGSSPPKRDRSEDEPQETTPSNSLNQLRISSPGSNDTADRKSFSPKRLFVKESTFREARQALHSSAPANLPGRESQLQELSDYLTDKLVNLKSGTMYISGPPGTGKTACLTTLLQAPQFKDKYKNIYINCTSVKRSGCIYARICEELKLKSSAKNEKDYLNTLDKYWSTNKTMVLLVLDELDQLDSKRQKVLYSIFEWPSQPESKLVIIGIANALDLTDRILPRLQAHLNMKPKLMHFPPYTKEQIVRILMERLKEMDVADVFSPVAIHLLAGKVAAVSGDVRRALDIGRRVLELAETQKISQLPLKPITDQASNTSSPRKIDGSVDLNVVMGVLNSVYGTAQSLSTDSGGDDGLPLQQKFLVCTLLLILKKGRSKNVTVSKMHEVYRKVCKKHNITAVDQAEFFSLCQLVETRGILKLQTRKETRLSKVQLMWDEEEVSTALQDKQLLATVLNDTTCL